MKTCRIFAAALAAAALVSCAPKTTVICEVEQAPDSDFMIGKLNVNTFSARSHLEFNAYP